MSLRGCLSGRFGNSFKASQDFISQNFLHKLSAGERNQCGKKNLLLSGEKWHFLERQTLKKKHLPGTDFTAMKMSGTPQSSIGNLSAFLGPSTCTKQELPFSKPLFPWKHFPPAVLVFLAGGQEFHFSPLHFPALVPEIWPLDNGFLHQPRPSLNQALTIQMWTLVVFLQLGTSVQQPKSSPQTYCILTRKKILI